HGYRGAPTATSLSLVARAAGGVDPEGPDNQTTRITPFDTVAHVGQPRRGELKSPLLLLSIPESWGIGIARSSCGRRFTGRAIAPAQHPPPGPGAQLRRGRERPAR